MPELPEVEITRRGILPYVLGEAIERVIVRNARLRWPIPRRLAQELKGQQILSVDRRAKYLLLRCDIGTVILHLGMSGSLRVLPRDAPIGRHDHVDWVLGSGLCLRLRDPRRFGAVLWTRLSPAERHKLLMDLGPEPLGDELNGRYLFEKSRRRVMALRNFLLDSKVVAGIGNIYSNEAAFHAGIHPGRPASKISRARYERLASSLKEVLRAAIARGGTTLRDFRRSDGRPGYFQNELNVYGREGEGCQRCGRVIVRKVIHGRSMFFCRGCQR